MMALTGVPLETECHHPATQVASVTMPKPSRAVTTTAESCSGHELGAAVVDPAQNTAWRRATEADVTRAMSKGLVDADDTIVPLLHAAWHARFSVR